MKTYFLVLNLSFMTTEDDGMVGWHHLLDGQEFDILGVGNGQGILACCSPWGHKESDTTE